MNWWFTNGHSYSMFRCLCWQSICHSECLDFDNSTENDSSPISSSKMSINTFPKFIQNDSTQLNVWCVLPLISMCHALHSLLNRKSHSITNNNNSTHRANVWSPPPKTKRRLSVCLLNYGNFMRLLSVYRLSICSFHSTQRIIFESNIEFHPTIRHTDYLLAARRCSTKNCMLLMLRTENYFSPKIVCKMQFYVAFISI